MPRRSFNLFIYINLAVDRVEIYVIVMVSYGY